MKKIKPKYQGQDEAIDVSKWPCDEEFAVYPEGARDKSLIFCPKEAPYNFCIPEHRYLFKHSAKNYPEQYWIEILAYRLGIIMGIDVPAAFVAFDSDNQQSGALIEWFIKESTEPRYFDNVSWIKKYILSFIHVIKETERYQPGGDVMQRIIRNYDRKKGTQHNFADLQVWCSVLEKFTTSERNWLEYWSKTFVFDALIGNTDRHQDNWGIIWSFGGRKFTKTRFTPVFDNGTSMGHEIIPEKFEEFNQTQKIEKYVSKGTHHMKWDRNDEKRMNHGEFLLRLCDEHPESRKWMLECLSIKPVELEDLVMDLTQFNNVPTPLTYVRAKFMLRLLQFRQQHLLTLLNG